MAANLRRLRIARHLSLSQLARQTAISKATLSGIENGRANPTVETLSGLARALRVPLTELVEDAPPQEMRVIRRNRTRLESPDGLPQRALDALTVAAGETIEVHEIVLPAGQAHESGAGPPGSRLGVYVLAGKLITGPVERSTELGAGDYASFPADAPFVHEAPGAPARALVIAIRP